MKNKAGKFKVGHGKINWKSREGQLQEIQNFKMEVQFFFPERWTKSKFFNSFKQKYLGRSAAIIMKFTSAFNLFDTTQNNNRNAEFFTPKKNKKTTTI